MSNLPLNSVENTRDNVTQSIDGNSNLSMCGSSVIFSSKQISVYSKYYF